MDIARGDYLVFAGLGSSVGMTDLPISRCEIQTGVFQRHWLPFESRSSISRDGYLGVLHNIVATDNRYMLDRIIRAGWQRKWTMGEGNFDYVNMYPLVPLMYAIKYGSWVPTVPTICVGKMKTGFRAHLLAITILLELRIGKRSMWHKWSVDKLVRNNPKNPMFRALQNYLYGRSQNSARMLCQGSDKWVEGCFGWGSCPPEVFLAVTKFIINMRKI